ncbi:MAG: MFS transporter [Gammaproteobacteria bacterium]|nr:MFS transporter [Gammaproteobacteria bacterium]
MKLFKRHYDDARHAWQNVAVCSVAIFFVLSAPAVLFPLMYASVMDEMGWSHGEVSGFSSTKFLSGALAALILGLSISRIRTRTLALLGSGLCVLVLFGVQYVSGLTGYYVCGFALGLSATVTSIACKVLLSRWFDAHLGRAVGIAFTAGSIAGAATPIIGISLLSRFGWQDTATLFGIAVCLLVIPLQLFVLREPPLPAATGGLTKRTETVTTCVTGPAAIELFGIASFWALLFAHFIVGAVDYSLLEHTALFIERDAQLGKSAAAGGVTLVMVGSICGKVGFGWLFDRWSMRGVAVCWWILALGTALAFPVAGAFSLTVFVVIRGIAHGGIMIDAPCIALHNFGNRAVAEVVCFLTVANLLGAAAGTTAVGYMRDVTGSYAKPFLVLILLALIAGTIAYRTVPQFAQNPGGRLRLPGLPTIAERTKTQGTSYS